MIRNSNFTDLRYYLSVLLGPNTVSVFVLMFVNIIITKQSCNILYVLLTNKHLSYLVLFMYHKLKTIKMYYVIFSY